MKRGIIVEAGERHWIVMTTEGQFRKIRKTHDAAIGEEVILSSRSPFAARTAVILLAAASIVLMLLALPSMLRSYPEVAVYLAIDFNPSLELGVDRHDRVLELRSWNADGATMIRDLQFENIGVGEVLDQIVERAREGQYLTSEASDVIITSVMTGSRPDASLEAKLANQVSRVLESALDLTVTVLSAPAELRDEAAEQGVTPGKMAVYLLAKHVNEPIRMKELRQLSIHQAMAAHGGLESIIRNLDAAAAREALQQMLLQELAYEGKGASSAHDSVAGEGRAQDQGELPPAALTPGQGRGAAPDAAPPRAVPEVMPLPPAVPVPVVPEMPVNQPPSPQDKPSSSQKNQQSQELPASPTVEEQPQDAPTAPEGNQGKIGQRDKHHHRDQNKPNKSDRPAHSYQQGKGTKQDKWEQGSPKEAPDKSNKHSGRKTHEEQKKAGKHEEKSKKTANPRDAAGQERQRDHYHHHKPDSLPKTKERQERDRPPHSDHKGPAEAA